jgi:hypothetical protein
VPIDHLVVTAPTLAVGVEYVADTLGVMPVPGGMHPRMGTHNALLHLGEGTYLEVIAVDPDVEPPAWPRWFDLDRVGPCDAPRLAAWVVRTSDLHGAVQRAPLPLGQIHEMHRGDLTWSITVLPDGRPVLEGAVPSLIAWGQTAHPTSRLPDMGCRLIELGVWHPQATDVSRVLDSIGFDGPVVVHTGPIPRLGACIDTGSGRKEMSSTLTVSGVPGRVPPW